MHVVDLLLLGIAAFAAGLVDAVVGGGGLILTPSLLLVAPQAPIAAVLGTIKCSSVIGTTAAALTYARQIALDARLLIPGVIAALSAACAGASLVSHLDATVVKPLILLALVVVAIYTALKPDLGAQAGAERSVRARTGIGIALGAVIGFYDGFLGPGTGSFLAVALVLLARFDFLRAAAHARVLNVASNLGAVAWFVPHGNVLWLAVLPMALCNLAGGVLGSRLALRQGSRWIRRVLLLVVSVLIVRLGWNLFG
ncbi:MAG TPA: TSUP family transporter [Planctomycetota bacterium]|nr:TSUP family transporter [Planctomycetota bacterium]